MPHEWFMGIQIPYLYCYPENLEETFTIGEEIVDAAVTAINPPSVKLN